MNAPFDPVEDRRAIIDPRALGDRIRGRSEKATSKILCDALEHGRKEIERRF